MNTPKLSRREFMQTQGALIVGATGSVFVGDAFAQQLNAEAARQAVFAAAWQVRGDLRRALQDFWLASRRAAQLRPQVESHRQILALLEQRRTAGAATAADVSTARLALIRTETAALDAGRQLAPASQRVAQVLGVSAAALATLPPSMSGTPDWPSSAALAASRRQALQSRADVLVALARYVVAESAFALEIERQHPGLHVGPGYQWDQGQSKWTVAFTFELPLFSHNEGPLAEAEAHRHEAAAQLAVVQAQVLAEIDSAVAAHTAVTGQISGLESVQDELKKQLALVEARLRAGVTDQLDLQNARLELALGEQALEEAGFQTRLAPGQLEDALQIPIASLEALAPASRASASPVSKKSP